MKTLKNWHFSRILRLLIALMLFGIAYNEHSYFMGVFGVILLYQAVMNVGCNGQRTCAINQELIENQEKAK
jgi:hypothetical protein